MRLIDADALMNDIKSDAEKAINEGDNAGSFWLGYIAGLVSIQPTAQRKKGKWIGSDGSYICSECNSNPIDFIETMSAIFDAYVEIPMNYCPNCGADMRRSEKDD